MKKYSAIQISNVVKKPFSRSNQISLPKKQTGAALLLFVLLIVVSASTLLVSKLNKAATQYYRDDVTMKALLKAKEALIGYAVSYRSVNNKKIGPGYLPCPDKNNPVIDIPTRTAPGFSERSCNDTNLIGRYPWRTLGLPDVRDSSGETLWYALSSDFRNNPRVQTLLNSETSTPNLLSINNEDDIIAIIFAPKETLGNNDRIGNNLVDPAHYLEDSDNDFNNRVFNSPSDSNDIYLTVTKQELMRVVEKRVLGEVSQALLTYRNNYSEFPWLSQFSDPSTENLSVATPPAFTGNATQREGQLAVHRQNQAFSTTFTFNWNITNDPTPDITYSGSITQTILNESGPILIDSPLLGSSGGSSECIWTDLGEVSCKGSGNFIDPTKGINRTYEVQVSFTDGDTNNPPPSNTIPVGTLITTLTLDRYHELPSSPVEATIQISLTDNNTGDTGTIAFDGDETATFTVSWEEHSLGTGANSELPIWFTANNWHHLIYVSYSPGFLASAPIPHACIPETDCLTVLNLAGSNNDLHALVVSAGTDLSPASPRPNDNIGDYFEAENSSPNDFIYERSAFPPDWNSFNDQVKVVAPVP